MAPSGGSDRAALTREDRRTCRILSRAGKEIACDRDVFPRSVVLMAEADPHPLGVLALIVSRLVQALAEDVESHRRIVSVQVESDLR